MATLYEIDQRILETIDTETGEILDDLALEALQMERTEKIENIVLWIKNLQADAAAYAAEKAVFDKREKQALAKAESLKKWLVTALDGQKFSTQKCAVTFRRSKRVEIINLESIPKAFLTTTTTTAPNKVEIKKAIESGRAVNGCALSENISAQIK